MKTVLYCLCFATVSTLCSFPVAWMAARMRSSFYLRGSYFSTDPVLFHRLWLLFTVITIVVGYILILPPSFDLKRGGNAGVRGRR